MYLGHSHLRLLLLLEELLLEQLEAVLGGQRGDGGRGAGAARAEQLLGAGQVEGAVFGILGTKKWAGEQIQLRLGFGFWLPTVLTPVQQRNPRTRGTEGVLRGSPGLCSAHLWGPHDRVFERGSSQRAGRAALAAFGEGRSPREETAGSDPNTPPPFRAVAAQAGRCPGAWSICQCLRPLPFLLLPSPAWAVPEGTCRKAQPFQAHKRIPWSACHCSCFQPGPLSVTVVWAEAMPFRPPGSAPRALWSTHSLR